MAETLVIQLLLETFDEDGMVQRYFRWGSIDEFSQWPENTHTGGADALIAAMAGQERSPLLMIPGNRVASLPVAYNKKEARHFLKMLPYQIEEEVLGAVDELQFAVGAKSDDVVTVAYVDREWFDALWRWFADNGIAITRCIPDYQCLQTVADELILWFTEGGLLGHRNNGLGFSVSESLAQPFLKDLLVNQQVDNQPYEVRVFVPDTETEEIIKTHIMPDVPYEVMIGNPPTDFNQSNQLNFCTGSYGQKLPLERWWQEIRPVAWLALAAVLVFFVSTFADIYLLKQQQDKVDGEMIAVYREAVPNGRADDPVRRLKGLLGSGSSSTQSSQSVYLLSRIAPVLDKSSVRLVTLNYSNRERAVRINVQAKSFNTLESIRQQLDEDGLEAELQSSNAIADGFQARLRVSLREGV